MSNRFDYIVFDFDGTLADTNQGIVETFQETFRQLGKPVPSVADISATIGLILSDGFKVLLNTDSEEEIDEAVRLYRKIFQDKAFSVLRLFPGVTDALDKIKARGVRMAIATSRSHLTLERMVDQLGLTSYFDVMVASEDVEHHKPAPDMVNLIIARYGLDPERVLVIGDTTYDLLMGQGGGCKVCGASWGNQSARMLVSVNPDYIISGMKELPGLLD